jgi:hypothetical protein
MPVEFIESFVSVPAHLDLIDPNDRVESQDPSTGERLLGGLLSPPLSLTRGAGQRLGRQGPGRGQFQEISSLHRGTSRSKVLIL